MGNSSEKLIVNAQALLQCDRGPNESAQPVVKMPVDLELTAPLIALAMHRLPEVAPLNGAAAGREAGRNEFDR